MNSSNIQSVAKRVIKIESEAVSLMAERIDQNFNDAVQSILECQGRLIVSGMGKSGLISQKIASTMASTGTPSHFVHPGEATHGDLGMIKKEDVVLIVSNSGETMELIQILPSLQKKGITIIGMIGRQNSSLSKRSDIYLDTSVEKEACTLDLAPTASTTATLAMGDALAVSLLEVRGFNEEDFAELHPGGILGKRLLLTLDQLTHSGSEIPFVSHSTSIKEALLTISEKGLGMTGVLNDKDEMVGIITDGDIRRGLENMGNELFDQTAGYLMSENPKWVIACLLYTSDAADE